jgi:hypothetical protein
MKLKAYQLLNITGLILTLVVNFLANALPIGGRTTGEVSANFESLFTPAGFTFAIWGLIYILLIAFVIYQSKGLFSSGDFHQNRFLYRIDVWFFLSCLANAAWIFAWHHQVIWLSMLLIFGLLFSLIMIYLNLCAGRRTIARSERFFVHVPFSIYLGWATVAAIANVSIFLLKINWNRFGFSPEFWAVVMVCVAIIVAFIALLSRKDVFFSLVIAWALYGIISKRASAAEPNQGIMFTAAAGIVLIFLIILFFGIKYLFKKKPAKSN